MPTRPFPFSSRPARSTRSYSLSSSSVSVMRTKPNLP
jgi:hypothetical protein